MEFVMMPVTWQTPLIHCWPEPALSHNVHAIKYNFKISVNLILICQTMQTVHAQTEVIQQQLLLLHPFNGLISRTTWVSQHQEGKPFWILLQQEMIGWQWHQLDYMKIICASLHTDNHASVPHHSVFYRPDALRAAQPTASKHWRQKEIIQVWNK